MDLTFRDTLHHNENKKTKPILTQLILATSSIIQITLSRVPWKVNLRLDLKLLRTEESRS